MNEYIDGIRWLIALAVIIAMFVTCGVGWIVICAIDNLKAI